MHIRVSGDRDGCVIFRLTAVPLGNENFYKGKFYDLPDQTV